MDNVDVKLRKLNATCGIAKLTVNDGVMQSLVVSDSISHPDSWQFVLNNFNSVAKQLDTLWNKDIDPALCNFVVAPFGNANVHADDNKLGILHACVYQFIISIFTTIVPLVLSSMVPPDDKDSIIQSKTTLDSSSPSLYSVSNSLTEADIITHNDNIKLLLSKFDNSVSQSRKVSKSSNASSTNKRKLNSS